MSSSQQLVTTPQYDPLRPPRASSSPGWNRQSVCDDPSDVGWWSVAGVRKSMSSLGWKWWKEDLWYLVGFILHTYMCSMLQYLSVLYVYICVWYVIIPQTCAFLENKKPSAGFGYWFTSGLAEQPRFPTRLVHGIGVHPVRATPSQPHVSTEMPPPNGRHPNYNWCMSSLTLAAGCVSGPLLAVNLAAGQVHPWWSTKGGSLSIQD